MFSLKHEAGVRVLTLLFASLSSSRHPSPSTFLVSSHTALTSYIRSQAVHTWAQSLAAPSKGLANLFPGIAGSKPEGDDEEMDD